MKKHSIGLTSVFCFSLITISLLGCSRDTDPGTETDPSAAVPLSFSKIEFPISVHLALENQPGPGEIADLKLTLDSTLPRDCTVEVELVLPGNVPLEKGRAREHRHLGARGKAEMAYRVRIPDAGRHVIEARVHLPNPKGLPATGGASLVIDPGAPEKVGKEPVTVITSDGRKLSVTVPE